MRGAKHSVRPRVLAGLAALALVAAACGGGGDDEADEPTTTTEDTVALDELEPIVDVDPCDLIDEATASELSGADVEAAESSTDDDGTTTCEFAFADDAVAEDTGSAIAASLTIGPGDEDDVPTGSSVARTLSMGDASAVEDEGDKVRVVYVVQQVVVFVEVTPESGEVDDELIDKVVDFTETTEPIVTEAVTGEPFVPDVTTTTFVDDEVPEGDEEIEIDGDTVELSFERAGGDANATFEAEAGDVVFLAFPSATYARPDDGNCLRISIVDPEDFGITGGTCVNPDGTTFLDRLELETTGVYQVVLSGDATQTGSVEVQLTSAPDEEGEIEIDGDTVTGEVTVPGARGVLSFEAEAGDAVFLAFPAATYTGPEDGSCLRVSITDPEGFGITGGTCVNVDGSSFIDRVELEDSGTYQLIIDGDGFQTGTVDIQLTAAD